MQLPDPLSPRQLTGLDDSHLVTASEGFKLQSEVAHAFTALADDARAAGFELAIASSYRSFARQLAIWNGKASGERPVHDDQGRSLDVMTLPPQQRLYAILRYSAIPGTSRHHWGTDLDVYDAAAVPADYRLQLTPQEVAPGAMFDPLHRWLDERMSGAASHGFYRPYGVDRGGVAPERWHLSYAPLAGDCSRLVSAKLLRDCWDKETGQQPLLLAREIAARLPQIIERFVQVPEGWCPAQQAPGAG